MIRLSLRTAFLPVLAVGVVGFPIHRSASAANDLLGCLLKKMTPDVDSGARLEPGLKKAFPSVSQLELPERLLKEIRASSVAAGTRARQLKGKGLVFIVPTESRHGNGLGLGEVTQGRFLVRTLHELFPDAKFVSPDQAKVLATDSKEKMIEVRFGDMGETIKAQYTPPKTHFDMSQMKGANGTVASIDRAEARKALGLSPNQPVVSIYASAFDVGGEEAFWKTWKQSSQSVFLYSSGGGPTSARAVKNSMRLFRDDFMVLNLSALQRGDMRGLIKRAQDAGKKLVIVNDVRGVVPYLHAASDVSCVYGYINPFESMNVGTPTVVYAEPERFVPMDQQNRLDEYYSPLFVKASDTGFFSRAADTKEVVKRAEELAKKGTIPMEQRPFLHRSEDGDSFLSAYFKNLDVTLRELFKQNGVQ